MGRGFGGGGFGGGGGSGGFSSGSNGGFFSNDGSFWHNHNSHRHNNSESLALGIFATVLFIPIVFFFFLVASPPKAAEIRDSTVWREPLAADMALGGIGYAGEYDKAPQTLAQSMQLFYEETGIMPYTFHIKVSQYGIPAERSVGASIPHIKDIVRQAVSSVREQENDLYQRDGNQIVFKTLPDDQQAQDFAEMLYNELFEDEAHLLVLHFYETDNFVSNSPSRKENIYYYCGQAAAELFDEEAGEIFLDCIAYYRFESNRAIGPEILADAFQDTASRIMGPPAPRRYTWLWWVGGILVAAVVGVGGVKLYRKKKAAIPPEKSEPL